MSNHPQSSILNPRRILVRGVNWLGDAVMTTPALFRLREHFPDALIALLTPQKLHGLWLAHPAIDEVIPFKSDETARQVASKIKIFLWPDEGQPDGRGQGVSRSAFDLAVVFPNSPRSALEMWLARIPQRVGYARPWRNFFLTIAVPPRPDAVKMHKRSTSEIKRLIAAPLTDHGSSVLRSRTAEGGRITPPASAHQVHDFLHLVAALGANPEPVLPQLAVTPGELKAVAAKFNLASSGPHPLLGLNPGAEYGPAKRWPVEQFIAAAREIQQRTHCTWVILGGKGDLAVAGQIEAAMADRTAVVNLAGQTALRELCAVLKLCRVLLTNDTGPMHVAAALGTPVVVPFGSTSPELTGPLSSGDAPHQLIQSDAPCAPCFLRECPIDFRCMNGIGFERVVDAVLQVVSGMSQ